MYLSVKRNRGVNQLTSLIAQDLRMTDKQTTSCNASDEISTHLIHWIHETDKTVINQSSTLLPKPIRLQLDLSSTKFLLLV